MGERPSSTVCRKVEKIWSGVPAAKRLVLAREDTAAMMGPLVWRGARYEVLFSGKPSATLE